MCFRLKSRIWVHQRRNNRRSDVIVDRYPTPMSVIREHLTKQKIRNLIRLYPRNRGTEYKLIRCVGWCGRQSNWLWNEFCRHFRQLSFAGRDLQSDRFSLFKINNLILIRIIQTFIFISFRSNRVFMHVCEFYSSQKIICQNQISWFTIHDKMQYKIYYFRGMQSTLNCICKCFSQLTQKVTLFKSIFVIGNTESQQERLKILIQHWWNCFLWQYIPCISYSNILSFLFALRLK